MKTHWSLSNTIQWSYESRIPLRKNIILGTLSEYKIKLKKRIKKKEGNKSVSILKRRKRLQKYTKDWCWTRMVYKWLVHLLYSMVGHNMLVTPCLRMIATWHSCKHAICWSCISVATQSKKLANRSLYSFCCRIKIVVLHLSIGTWASIPAWASDANKNAHQHDHI